MKKITKMKNTILLFTFVVSLIQISCKKEQNSVQFESPQIQSTTYNSAIISNIITANGGSEINSKGICYSIAENPTIANDTISGGSGMDAFNSSMTNLTPNTKYFVRTYARNDNGIFYSNQTPFTTVNATVPILTTNAITSIGSDIAISGGNVTNNGGVAISDRGICWATTPNPTIANSKVSSGSGDGLFTSNISGLAPNTKYYVRAFATNNIGTSYGNELSFTTTVNVVKGAGVTDIEGNVYESYIIGGQEWMTQNLKTTKFSNGDTIPFGKQRYPGDDALKYEIYGNTYEMYYISSETRNVCPTGWKLPTVSDFEILINNFGGAQVAGDALRNTTLWSNPNNATNVSKFSALPMGTQPSNGHPNAPIDKGNAAYFLTKESKLLKLWFNLPSTSFYDGFGNNTTNVSIRCIKQ